VGDVALHAGCHHARGSEHPSRRGHDGNLRAERRRPQPARKPPGDYPGGQEAAECCVDAAPAAQVLASVVMADHDAKDLCPPPAAWPAAGEELEVEVAEPLVEDLVVERLLELLDVLDPPLRRPRPPLLEGPEQQWRRRPGGQDADGEHEAPPGPPGTPLRHARLETGCRSLLERCEDEGHCGGAGGGAGSASVLVLEQKGYNWKCLKNCLHRPASLFLFLYLSEN